MTLRRTLPFYKRSSPSLFDPISIGSMELWFDSFGGNDFSFYPEGGIQTWNDKSPNLRHAQNLSGSLIGPIYGTDPTNINNMLIFNSGKWLQTPDFSLSGFPITMFVITRNTGGGVCSYYQSGFLPYIGFRHYNSPIALGYTQRIGIGEFTSFAGFDNRSDFNVYEGVSVAGNDYRFAVNGSSYSSIGNDSGEYNPAINKFLIGRMRTAGSVIDISTNSPIAEIIMFSKQLNTEERSNLLTYWKNKWSLTSY